MSFIDTFGQGLGRSVFAVRPNACDPKSYAARRSENEVLLPHAAVASRGLYVRGH